MFDASHYQQHREYISHKTLKTLFVNNFSFLLGKNSFKYYHHFALCDGLANGVRLFETCKIFLFFTRDIHTYPAHFVVKDRPIDVKDEALKIRQKVI